MRKYIIFMVQVFICISMGSVAFGSYETGEEAYSKGDYATAMKEFLGDSSAKSLLRIGSMYFEGKGVSKDSLEAAKWVRKAAERGDLKAKTNLGVMHLKGEGVELNKKFAFELMLDAANGGFALAQSYLGLMYYEGNGIRKDIIEAIKWFKKASDNGEKPATEALESIGQSVEWKKNDNNFQAMLILFTESGESYPNTEHSSGSMTQSNWLSMKASDSAFATVFFQDCHLDSNKHCGETVDLALFGPDWKLHKEARNLKLYEDIFPDAKGVWKRGDIMLAMEIEDSDIPGIYHIVATVYDQDKPRVELIQFFWVNATNK